MEKERKLRALKAAALLLALGAALCLVALVWKPACQILKTTGYYCAGCGGQRMLWALLRGDFLGALRHNPLLFFLLPLAAGYILTEAARYVQNKRPLYKSRRFVWILAAVLFLTLAFTVLRNLPGFGWLGPE